MYVIKMKTIIYYFAVFAITLAGIGIIKLHTESSSVFPTSAVTESSNNETPLGDSEKADEALPSAIGEKKTEVPILMYHNIFRSSSGHGNYIISEAAFEQDLKFLKENGYTTIVMQDLIDFVYEGKVLPEKPVVLTFDDGYSNNFLYAYPLLEKYNSKAVLSIIGYYTDLYTKSPDENPSYSHITWDNIKKMMDSKLVEFQNHSYNLHTTDKGRNGTKKKRGESEQQYRKILSEDLGKLQDEFKSNTGYTPSTFTYPFGSVSNASFEIIKELGFKASLSCESGMNKVSRDPECLYMMKRYLRTPNKSAETILN